MKITFEIEDEFALAAIDAERARIVAAGGDDWSVAEYLTDFVTTQHVRLRESQLVAAATAKMQDDPDLKAYRDARAAKDEAVRAAKAEAVVAEEAAVLVAKE